MAKILPGPNNMGDDARTQLIAKAIRVRDTTSDVAVKQQMGNYIEFLKSGQDIPPADVANLDELFRKAAMVGPPEAPPAPVGPLPAKQQRTIPPGATPQLDSNGKAQGYTLPSAAPGPRPRPPGYQGGGTFTLPNGRTIKQGVYESDRDWQSRSAKLRQKYFPQPATPTMGPGPDFRGEIDKMGNQAAAAQDSANRANKQRLGAALGLWSGYGQAESADIDQDFSAAAGREAQRLMSSGIASSTVLGPIMARYRGQASREKARVRAYARGQQSGILERANDIGPDVGALSEYATRYGRSR